MSSLELRAWEVKTGIEPRAGTGVPGALAGPGEAGAGAVAALAVSSAAGEDGRFTGYF